eukprot:m.239253 g.239253  ORF g.239253 m.239253 type:complete len:93 (-) comp54366_c3_seq6:100-378(-)
MPSISGAYLTIRIRNFDINGKSFLHISSQTAVVSKVLQWDALKEQFASFQDIPINGAAKFFETERGMCLAVASEQAEGSCIYKLCGTHFAVS